MTSGGDAMQKRNWGSTLIIVKDHSGVRSGKILNSCGDRLLCRDRHAMHGDEAGVRVDLTLDRAKNRYTGRQGSGHWMFYHDRLGSRSHNALRRLRSTRAVTTGFRGCQEITMAPTNALNSMSSFKNMANGKDPTTVA